MKTPFRPAPLALTVAAVLTAGCTHTPWSKDTAAPVTKADVVEHYADLAYANYQDALTTARALDEATDRLIANPTEHICCTDSVGKCTDHNRITRHINTVPKLVIGCPVSGGQLRCLLVRSGHRHIAEHQVRVEEHRLGQTKVF